MIAISQKLKICEMAVLLCFALLIPQRAFAFKRIYLTSGDPGSWPVASDWSDANTIEAIGAGGGGGDGTTAGGGGGGGGAYAAIYNLTGLSGSISYQIGSTTSAVATANSGKKGGDTWFNRTSGNSATCSAGNMSVCAQGGGGGTAGTSVDGAGGAGGTKLASIGTFTNAGGSGGTGKNGSDSGGGGGGAGGPYGTGGLGSDGDPDASLTTAVGGGGGGADGGAGGQVLSAGATVGANGGNNYFGAGGGTGGNSAAGGAGIDGGGGGGGADSNDGGVGGNGTIEWTAVEFGIKGAGGGGGGGGDAGNGGNGGLYGGGGGGSEGNTEGLGAAGLIVLTYSPDVPASARATRLLGKVRLNGGVRLLQAPIVRDLFVFGAWLADKVSS